MNEHEKYEILISALIDGEVTKEEETIIKEHIKDCASCKELLTSTKKLSSTLEMWNDEILSPDLENKIQNNLQFQEGKKMNSKISKTKIGVGISMVIIVSVLTSQYYTQRSLQTVAERTANGIYKPLVKTKLVMSDKNKVLKTQVKIEAVATLKKKPSAVHRFVREVKSTLNPRKLSKSMNNLASFGATRMRVAADDIGNQFSPGKVLQHAPYYLSQDYEENGAIEIYRDGKRFQPYEKFNTEQYDRIYENEFLKVSENPLSTFSIDVDTASYSNIRRFLNMGQMPQEDSIRIEEMINYFSYDYPEPIANDSFSITTKAAVCPWNKDHDIVLVGLHGKTLSEDEIPPSNLVFLIDVSGSMNSANKLPLLKNAFNLLVKQLGSEDRVALVVYAGAAGVVLESTSGNQNIKILNAINHLSAGGSTAGGAGIKLAYEIATKNLIKDGNNRVILATDGDFNIGVSSDGALTRLIEEKRKEGVFLTVLGFGMGNYKDSRMEKIADKGNGNYYYIDTLKEAKKVLVNELGSTLFTIAKDVKIQIEFNPLEVKAYRLIGYENRILAKEDFNDDTKDAGELGAGHTVTALYELVPADSTEDFGNVDDLLYQKAQITKSDDLMTVKFRYKEPNEDKSRLIKKSIKFNEIAGSLSGDFQFAVSVSEFGLLLRNSKYKGTADYSDVLSSARASAGNDPFGYRSEFIQLVEKARSLDVRSAVGNGKIQFKGNR